MKFIYGIDSSNDPFFVFENPNESRYNCEYFYISRGDWEMPIYREDLKSFDYTRNVKMKEIEFDTVEEMKEFMEREYPEWLL